eukprot:TRINITY_DN5430_c0_g1_i3.p1 TRINITY_DN5430_c0_g1~~TRINITY_DN5430_c0_g1_i3.p1  ORF type:complete len:248 (+),score=80.14 TRINITY_DN5430_c0_g1_i3:68-745(+)
MCIRDRVSTQSTWGLLFVRIITMQAFSRRLLLGTIRHRSLYTSQRRLFGGIQHHDHHHEEPTLELNKNENYVANKNFEKDLTAIYGFDDANLHEHAHHEDPYAHLRGQSFFSFRRIYFSDPYYHPDDHEPLMNEPHGYISGDNPLDVRNLIERPALDYLFFFCFAISIGYFFGHFKAFHKHPAQHLYSSHMIADNLEDEIQRQRQYHYALVKRREELRAELAGLE